MDAPLTDDLAAWYEALTRGVPQGAGSAACTALIAQVQPSVSAPGSRGAYAVLYLGAAEGCVGDKPTARRHLQTARELIPKLESAPDRFVGKDTTCQPEQLLIWAYDKYLTESIAVPCRPSS